MSAILIAKEKPGQLPLGASLTLSFDGNFFLLSHCRKGHQVTYK